MIPTLNVIGAQVELFSLKVTVAIILVRDQRLFSFPSLTDSWAVTATADASSSAIVIVVTGRNISTREVEGFERVTSIVSELSSIESFNIGIERVAVWLPFGILIVPIQVVSV